MSVKDPTWAVAFVALAIVLSCPALRPSSICPTDLIDDGPVLTADCRIRTGQHYGGTP